MKEEKRTVGEKIVITKDDEEKFNEIKEWYIDAIQGCATDERFDDVVFYAKEIAKYEGIFWGFQRYFPEYKLIFYETVCKI